MTYGEVLMKKKLWQFFLLSALAILLVLAAAAADNVVFVKDGGTGSGATAAAPLGDLSTALTAVKAGGTVVSAVRIPSMTGLSRRARRER